MLSPDWRQAPRGAKGGQCGKADTEGHILCDPIAMKCAEEVNPERQIADLWWSGSGDGENGR